MKTKTLRLLLLIALIFSLLTPSTIVRAAGVLYVKPGGTGDCSSWSNACTLQTALTNAVSGDEIWVATGTYKPTAVGTDRSATFQLKTDVALYGGFAGTETARDQRDPATNVTVLSGDIDNNDSQTPVITDLATVTGNTTNSYHVVTGTTTTGATLDGFTITAGNANTTIYPNNCGGGMRNYYSNPALVNVTFSGNSAYDRGGAIFNYFSTPPLTNVTLSGNKAHYGGGISNEASSPTLSDVTFSGNTASYSGGGMYNSWYSNPTLTDVTFSGNDGGGMYNDYSSPTLTNVTFSGNDGGGMSNNNYSNPALTDVTFTGNSADWGGGMHNESYSNPTLTDVTFTNNSANSGGGGMYNTESSPLLMNVTFSDNSANSGGGGMGNSYSAPILMNVTFSDNSANSGGGMGNWGSNSTLINVTFSGNTADNAGGGMYNNQSSNPNLTNVSFTGNTANDRGGGIAHDNSSMMLTNVTFSGNTAINSGGGMHIFFSSAQIRNSIFWGNTAANGTQIYNSSSTPILSDDIVQGGCPAGSECTNIISADPLLGTLGDYGGLTQTIPLQAGSSAIDTGNDTVCPATDQRGITRPQGTHCDIGAYEYVDTSAPTVTSITRLNSSPTNLVSVGFTVTFSESVTGVDTGDFALNTSGVTGASITGVSGGATAYTVTINTGTGNGTIRLDVPISASINDLSGNPLTGLPYTSGDSYTIDKTAPAVAMTSLAADPTNASPIAVSVTFSESVTGFTSTDIVPTNGTVSNFTGSGASYTFDLIPAGQGLVKADIAAGVATDSAGNGNTVASQFSRLYDPIAPTVLSSLRANPNPTNLASVSFTVTFSESVTGVNVSDFSLATTGVSGAFVSGVSGSGSVYTVTVNTGSGIGTIRLDVVDNDSIVDLASNALGGAGADNGSYTSGEVYDVRFYLTQLPLVIK